MHRICLQFTHRICSIKIKKKQAVPGSGGSGDLLLLLCSFMYPLIKNKQSPPKATAGAPTAKAVPMGIS